MFYHEDVERLKDVIGEHRRLTQIQGCVIDLMAARDAVTTDLQTLEDAHANCQTFVGPGEDRWVMIGDTAHHLTNIDGTVNIEKYMRKD